MDSKQIAEAMRLKLPVRYNGITYQQITEYILWYDAAGTRRTSVSLLDKNSHSITRAPADRVELVAQEGGNSITKETRRESYDAILPKVKKRSRLILETLGDRQMTASEITEELVAAGKIPYFNRNYVAPRLTELKDIGVLETVGRRKATRSDATEAVWARKELPHEPR